ncbi:MAG: DUF3489 domain-containing protein [Magnetococcales bacterium]|nr:DUF3489 domain-containing protein [Magnetococcales bacterium]
MSELTTTQKSILEAAAARPDGAIQPLPPHIKGGAARKVIDSMATKGLIVDADGWRITTVGYHAIGLEAPKAEETKTKRTRENSKKAQVIGMLKRPEGATTAQIAEATGWQPHSIRGFLSLARSKMGLQITTNRLRVIGPNQQGSPGSFTTYFA